MRYNIISKQIQHNFCYINQKVMQLLKRSIRQTYAILEKDVTALRNQLLFRSKNLGVRELDLIVGSWARHNIPKYSSQQLHQYNKQVLQHETPDLLKKILGQLEIANEEKLIEQIRSFALNEDYSKIQNT